MELASISFSEPMEIKRLAQDLRIELPDAFEDLPPDTPQHIVSITLPARLRARRRPSFVE